MGVLYGSKLLVLLFSKIVVRCMFAMFFFLEITLVKAKLLNSFAFMFSFNRVIKVFILYRFVYNNSF